MTNGSSSPKMTKSTGDVTRQNAFPKTGEKCVFWRTLCQWRDTSVKGLACEAKCETGDPVLVNLRRNRWCTSSNVCQFHTFDVLGTSDLNCLFAFGLVCSKKAIDSAGQPG
ncbi:hypothetical protein CRM22_007085 [Opisthorchis felineus]|uniref:Uncharacterized protein n=1 Tax=Opisthorchis felineus TaxID=147828 RepID=A0A4S2LQA8_OPIFE|nr:hypothetical protein CRM22_007085 [Opisthorchis felineus]